MITDHIKNCIGIDVPVSSEDKEFEVDKLPGILTFFHMTFRQKAGQYTVRIMECMCVNCNQGKYNACLNKSTCKTPSTINVKLLGERQPVGRETIWNEKSSASSTEEFVVEDIVAERTKKVKKTCQPKTNNSNFYFSGKETISHQVGRL